MDWFLYDRDLRHERFKMTVRKWQMNRETRPWTFIYFWDNFFEKAYFLFIWRFSCEFNELFVSRSFLEYYVSCPSFASNNNQILINFYFFSSHQKTRGCPVLGITKVLTNSFDIRSRSSRPEVFCKKGVLRNFPKIHRKTPVPESLF